MSDAMFVLHDGGGLDELRPEGYLLEADLQLLVAEHPDLLPGAGINPAEPRRWLLIRREAGIGDADDSGVRWSVDHLFLDQDAIPTLVEVKRSSDTRIRREVVGQMLDYAANAVAYLSVEQMRAWLSAECAKRELDEETLLVDRLGVEGDPEEFWVRVKTNLQAGRVRMLFVADVIPPELRRIVEFLNGQLNPAEVLAIEIAQYRGPNLRTLVPRVIGQSERAQATKSAGRPASQKWDLARSLVELQKDTALADLANEFTAWARERNLGFMATKEPEVRPEAVVGMVHYPLFSIHHTGRVYLQFGWWLKKPILGDQAERVRVADEIHAATGVQIPLRALNGYPSFPATALEDPTRRAAFLAVFDRLVRQLSSGGAR